MRKLEGFELVNYVAERLGDTTGADVEYKAVVFNNGIHLDTYINGVFIEKRKFEDYDALELFLYEVLQNMQSQETTHSVALTNADLIRLLDLEHPNLAHAILKFLNHRGIKLCDEYSINYYFLETYHESRPKPVDDEDTMRELLAEEASNRGRYYAGYHNGETFIIRVGAELADLIELADLLSK